MITITFNAFSFLRKKLKKQGFTDYVNAKFAIENECSLNHLIENILHLKEGDVEAVFLNGKVVDKNTIIKNGDRVALVPPGTPGSYRLQLGMKKRE